MKTQYGLKTTIEWFLVVLAVFFCQTTVNNSSEKYIFLSIFLIIMIVHTIFNQGLIRFRFTGYHLYLLSICAFCYLSSKWAINGSRAIGKGNTMVEIIALMCAIFICATDNKEPVDFLLKAIMWGNFFVVVYSVFYYGLDGILYIIQNESRIDNSLMNANSIGMCAAYAILIGIYYILYDGFKVWNVILAPCLIIVVASASRKAIAIIGIGLVLLVLLKSTDNKKILRSIGYLALSVFALIILGLIVSKLPLFQAPLMRIHNMISAFKGGGDADQSALTRIQLMEIGISIFKAHPMLGVGMDNATEIVAPLFYKEYYYLHNNYVELLADGGVVGFVIYYSIYGYLIFILLRYRTLRDRQFNMCIVLLVTILLMDIGAVSYLMKCTYIFVMLFFFCVEKTRRISARSNKDIIAKGII